MFKKRYAPHLIWAAFVVAAFVAHSFAPYDPGRVAALFARGLLINFFDPFVWLLAAIPATLVLRQRYLLLSLFAASVALTFFKLYMEQSTDSSWLSGSILGNVFGFISVGYVINAIVLLRRSKKQQAVGGA